MKILYDHLALSVSKFGGVQRYFVELMKRMPTDEYQLSVIFSLNEYLYNSDIDFLGKPMYNFLSRNIKGKKTLINAINQTYSKFCLKQGNYDIYHQTHYNNFGFQRLPKNKKVVTTIHDLNYWVIPQFYAANYPNYLPQREMVERADKIIVVSQNTKKDLLNVFNVTEEKVDVIYHGATSPNLQLLPPQRVVYGPYILYVGSRYKFKNFTVLAQAFSKIKHKFPELKIVCTGTVFSQAEKEQFSKLNILQSIVHMPGDDIILGCLYRDAEMFIYPSFYEGFGMPALEAMNYGCPVILANSSCFPEIAADAAMYFNPEDADELSMKILLLLEDRLVAQALVQKGYERAKLFSWEKCFEEHMRVYHSLLN